MAKAYSNTPLFAAAPLFATAPLFAPPAAALVYSNTETGDWLAVQSPKPPQAYVTAIDDVVTGMKADGTFTLFKGMWFTWGPYLQVTNFKVPAGTAATLVGPLQFTPYRGVMGDALTAYINLGVSPNSLGIALNSESLFVFALSNVAANTYSFGTQGSAIITRRSTGNNVTGNSQTTTATSGTAGTMLTSVGLSAINRSGSTNFIFYKNGAAYETITRASVAVSTDNLFACARNNGSGTAVGLDNRIIGFVGIASSMTAPQHASVNTRLQAMAVAIGAA